MAPQRSDYKPMWCLNKQLVVFVLTCLTTVLVVLGMKSPSLIQLSDWKGLNTPKIISRPCLEIQSTDSTFQSADPTIMTIESSTEIFPKQWIKNLTQTTPTAKRLCSQWERQQHMLKACAALEDVLFLSKSSVQPRFIVDDKRKLAYCIISKGGCSQMNGIMLAGNTGNMAYLNQSRGIHSEKLLASGNLRRTTNYASLAGYKKILVVRSPFTRTLSAFNNLRFGSTNGPHYFRNSLTEMFPSAATPDGYVGKLTLEQFLTFINSNEAPNKAFFDYHLLPMQSSCDLCNVKYDYIHRLETLGEDLKPVLKLFDLPENLLSKAKPMNKGRGPDVKTSNNQTINKFSQFIPEFASISHGSTTRYLNRFKADMLLLGYKFDVQHKQSHCVIPTTNGDTCC